MTARLSLVLIAGLATTLGGTALAQDKAPSKDGQPKVLEGPRVQDGGVPGQRRAFGPGDKDRKDMQREIPHMMFMRVINSMRGPQAAEEVRLSDEQASKIAEIDRSFTDRVDAFREKNAKEIRELAQSLPPEDRARLGQLLGVGRPGEGRGDARPGEGRPGADRPGARRPGERGPDAQRPGDRGPGDRAPGADRPARRPEGGRPQDGMTDEPGARERPDPAKAEQARERLKELMKDAPKAADTHAQIVGVLNDAQKKEVQTKLENARKEMEKRRADADGRNDKPLEKATDKAKRKIEKGQGEDAKRPAGKRPEGKRPAKGDAPKKPE